jgi:hypothetical protein
MVRNPISLEDLSELFDVVDGKLMGRYVPWRRKESNTRVAGKELGYRRPDGYLQVNFKDRFGILHRMLVHRLIYYMHYGKLPTLVDHINRNPLDNRIENLRVADKSINAYNTQPRRNNSSGKKGVHLYKGKYRASIYLEGKKVHLGSFERLEDACEAVNTRRYEEIKQARARGYISPLEGCAEAL